MAINTCLDYCYVFNIGILVIYWWAKITLGIIMLITIQNDYYGSWDNNTCVALKPLTLFWLIWNYIIISISVFCFIIYITFPCCDC